MSDTKEHIYSDGSIEQRIAEYLLEHKGNSSHIIEDIPEGAVFHNFCSARKNLLQWYPFSKECRVLEIGAGMGALTPFLAENCGSVVAIEPSPDRAGIISLRCQHMKNVQVITKNLEDYDCEGQLFDYVLLIGVLEYAGTFGKEKDPWGTMLRKARSFLKSDGRLLLAIENKFGLKYWCGASEDHTGIPFDSIDSYHKSNGATERYQGRKGVRTFSQNELREMLTASGFSSQKFFYMLPDYKFPMLALTDHSDAAETYIGDIKFNYPEESTLIANEAEIFPDIIRNGSLGFFANSFLVEACAQDTEQCDVNTAFMKRDYKKEFRLITTIKDKTVQRFSAESEGNAHLEKLISNTNILKERGVPCLVQKRLDNGSVVSEKIMADRADQVFSCAVQKKDYRTALRMLDTLKEYLLKSSTYTQADEKIVLNEGFIDLTFRNSFWENDDLIFIDQEWCVENVPLNYILYRSIRYSVNSNGLSNLNFLLEYCGIMQEDIPQYEEFEKKFLESLMDAQNCYWFDRTMYDKRLSLESKEKAAIANKQAHIELLLQSERNLQRQNWEQQENIEKIQTENKKLHEEIEQLQQKYWLAEGRHEQVFQQQQEAIKNTSEKLKSTETMLSQIKEKEAEWADLYLEAQKQVKDLKTLDVQMENIRTRNSELVWELSESQEENLMFRKKLDNGRRETQALQVKLNNSNGEVQQLRDKENRYLNQIDAINTAYTREIEDLKCSKTWRIGRVFITPIRFLVPEDSRRAALARLLVAWILHPIRTCKRMTTRDYSLFVKGIFGGNKSDAWDVIGRVAYDEIQGLQPFNTMEVHAPELISMEKDNVNQKTAADYAVLNVPQWENPKVSIVIPVYNQFEYTYHCVESIMKNSGPISYEIIIANDCSQDLTTQIDQIIHGITCVTNEKNLRFLRNCNHAATFAKGEYILFLNNDTQVQENWLEPLVTLIESSEDIGMVGSKLIYPDGLLQEAGGILWKDGSAWNYGNRQNPNLPEFNYVKQVDYISGAAIMLSRKLWNEIGGFDEYFAPAYCEDSDLAFTVRKMGYRVMYQPLSIVVHFEGVSNGTDTSVGQKKYQIENSKKFRKKWAEELNKHPDNAVNVFQAREYSFGKKTVLMIDHYVPTYDKDAGSRTIYQYIKLLVELGYNVKFIGDNFYPMQPYTTDLEQMGVEILYGTYYMENWKSWVSANAEYIDVVFMNRPHISEKYIDYIRENTKAKIIYNLCDLHFLREMREYEITGDESHRELSEQWKPRELALVDKADRAFSLSCDEKKILEEYFPEEKIAICPIFIYDEFVECLPNRNTSKDLLFVGGFSHDPNVDAVKWFCSCVFPKISKQIQGVVFHIVGSNPPEEIQKLAACNIIIEGFVSDERLDELYSQCRVDVIPLRYGAGVKGKTIEAMYHGIPIVTTSIGIEGLPKIEKCITAQDDAENFADQVIRVYEDENPKSRQLCYEYVREHYSMEATKKFFQKEFL